MAGQWNRLIALIARDAAVLALTAALWAWTLKLGGASGAAPIAVHLLTALFTVFVGYLVHEWGHLLGAWRAGSVFELPATPFETFFLFRFDATLSTRPQFFSMALGGFASSLLMVAFLIVALPSGLLASYVALGLTTLGVIATLVIEVPEFWGVWRGGPLPNGAAFVKHPDGV